MKVGLASNNYFFLLDMLVIIFSKIFTMNLSPNTPSACFSFKMLSLYFDGVFTFENLLMIFYLFMSVRVDRNRFLLVSLLRLIDPSLSPSWLSCRLVRETWLLRNYNFWESCIFLECWRISTSVFCLLCWKSLNRLEFSREDFFISILWFSEHSYVCIIPIFFSYLPKFPSSVALNCRGCYWINKLTVLDFRESLSCGGMISWVYLVFLWGISGSGYWVMGKLVFFLLEGLHLNLSLGCMLFMVRMSVWSYYFWFIGYFISFFCFFLPFGWY